jgi:hypothetical protein
MAPSDPGPGAHHSTYNDMENRFKHAPKVSSAFAKVTTHRYPLRTLPCISENQQ